MLGWQQPAASQKDLQLQDDEDDDNDWEEEFNKFYDSPLDKIDEIKWLENVLKGEGRPYLGLLNISQQEEISLYFTNAPPKQWSFDMQSIMFLFVPVYIHSLFAWKKCYYEDEFQSLMMFDALDFWFNHNS